MNLSFLRLPPLHDLYSSHLLHPLIEGLHGPIGGVVGKDLVGVGGTELSQNTQLYTAIDVQHRSPHQPYA